MPSSEEPSPVSTFTEGQITGQSCTSSASVETTKAASSATAYWGAGIVVVMVAMPFRVDGVYSRCSSLYRLAPWESRASTEPLVDFSSGHTPDPKFRVRVVVDREPRDPPGPAASLRQVDGLDLAGHASSACSVSGPTLEGRPSEVPAQRPGPPPHGTIAAKRPGFVRPTSQVGDTRRDTVAVAYRRR